MNQGANLEVDTTSPAYKAFTAGGFTFKVVVLTQREDLRGMPTQYTITFQCVCGSVEDFCALYEVGHSPKYIRNGRIDAAQWLEDIGALSPAHLRRDGYTEEQIERIRAHF